MKFFPSATALATAIAATCLSAAPVGAQDEPAATATQDMPTTAPADGVAEEDEVVAAPQAAPAAKAETEDAPAALAAAPACELHIFPTLEGQAMTTGWLSGLGIAGAIADAASNKDRNLSEAEYLKQALGPQMQVEAFQSIDVLDALKLPPSQIIWETPIADRKISTKATTRLSSSTAPCYMELLVTQNFYTKRAIYGRSLNNRFIFKDFRDGKSTTDMQKGRGGNGLSFFPPKSPDETEAAENELRDVFVKNFLEYAKGVKPAK